jgi:HK97 gp10 family phage protein
MLERNRPSFQRLRSRFAELNKVAGRPLLRQIARQGAAIARKEAQRIAPFQDRTGAARKNLLLKERRAPVGEARYVVAFGAKRRFGKASSGWYLRLLETGTQPHPIGRGVFLHRRGPRAGTIGLRQKRGTLVSFANQDELKIVLPGGRILFRRLIWHPGSRARPFLKNALDNTTAAVLDNTQRLLRAATERLAAGGVV